MSDGGGEVGSRDVPSATWARLPPRFSPFLLQTNLGTSFMRGCWDLGCARAWADGVHTWCGRGLRLEEVRERGCGLGGK